MDMDSSRKYCFLFCLDTSAVHHFLLLLVLLIFLDHNRNNNNINNIVIRFGSVQLAEVHGKIKNNKFAIIFVCIIYCVLQTNGDLTWIAGKIAYRKCCISSNFDCSAFRACVDPFDRRIVGHNYSTHLVIHRDEPWYEIQLPFERS